MKNINIIFIGAPGTGKGTQSELISKIYDIPKISVGELLRKIINNNNISNKIKLGNLIPDNIVCDIVKTRLYKNDCDNGFILDGFPRNINQAQYLTINNIKINFVFNIKLSYKIIIKRLLGRRIHRPSGRIYHIKYNPPLTYGVDNITNEQLVLRKDDNIKVIKHRLKIHSEQIGNIINYYKQEVKLGNIISYKEIDGFRSINLISSEIVNIINSFS
ncbi:MAG: nucleoside monophosphate kinase [Candidatus Lightella neohaematopini]|nr:nucleoside monophosphate kinase [Candidatus Lightella neohaematopini]MCV2528933.1 nucleoside monophosphate kinase [Candidatus Lightella neohaematopini]